MADSGEQDDKVMMFTSGVSSKDLQKQIDARSTHFNSDPCDDECVYCLEERRQLIAYLAEKSPQ